jgi:hypothetical protein
MWLFPPGGALVVALFAWLKQVPLYLILFYAIATMTLVFLGINQIGIFRERHKRGFSTQSNENIESVLRKWLDKRQYPSEHKIDQSSLFCFIVTDKQKRPINIFRPQDNPDVIRLLLVINEEDLGNVPIKQQNILRHRIGVEMARFGLLCHASKPMYIHLDLPCDDLLTEPIFLNAIDKIRQAHVLMAANVQAVLGTVAKSPSGRLPQRSKHGH